MKQTEFISEGGWSSTATQSTVINPSVVKQTLNSLQKFTSEFNKFLQKKGIEPVRVGRPTGSSAHHNVDPEDKVYGDIDVQMIGSPIQGISPSQYSAYYNKLADEFIKTNQPNYLHPTDSSIGHPIFKVGDNQYVQVDLMWHTPELEKWGAARVTPERGVKGSLFGNMFSVLGELLDMSIQHAGVQFKVIDGQRVPFSKQKNTQIQTITINPDTFLLDIFKYFARQGNLKKAKITKDLTNNSGTNLESPSVSKLISGVKGLANSLQANDLFGKGELSNFSSKDEFLQKFLQRYQEKAVEDLEAKKREKASTPQAIERANKDREKIVSGLAMVKKLFADSINETFGLPMPGTYEQEYKNFKKKGGMQLTALTTEDGKIESPAKRDELIKGIWGKEPRYLVYGEKYNLNFETNKLDDAIQYAKTISKMNLDSLSLVYDRIKKMPIAGYKGSEDLFKSSKLHEQLTTLETWSKKYKKSINCNNPKGFSQKAHCAGRKARQAGKHTKSKSISEYGEIDKQRKIVYSKENPPPFDYLYQQFIQTMLSTDNNIQPQQWIDNINKLYGLSYKYKDYQNRGHRDYTNNWDKIVKKYILKV